MSEAAVPATRKHKLHYRGRGGQAIIYIGKLLRGFIYQSDWIVLPMAALIAGIVSMVVHKDFFITMEGTLKGALALTCLSIWNGCFNSIQVVCREREIIKREHRAGLHITAYIFSHMVYQGLLCLGQTAITLFVCRQTGIHFPSEGLFTPWLIVDLGITIFFITFSSDMLSLWISCICRSTTTAMTVMPFVLIFQLVFSGGIFTLPPWADNLAAMSISNFGMKCIAAQSDYNNRILVTGWNSLVKVENQEINTTVTLGQVMDFLTDDSKSLVRDLRDKDAVIPSEEDVLHLLSSYESSQKTSGGLPGIAEVVDNVKTLVTPAEAEGQTTDRATVKLGEVIDFLAQSSYIQEQRDLSYSFSTTLAEIMDMVGRDKLQTYVQEETARANHVAAYENTKDNIMEYWFHIVSFAVIFSLLSVIFLEFVDKDKR